MLEVDTGQEFWTKLLWILLLLSPLAILFLLPGRNLVTGGIWFWLTLLVTFWLILSLLGSSREEKPTEPQIRMLGENEEPSAIREVMNVRAAIEESGVKVFRGKLLVPPPLAYEKLKGALRGEAIPMVTEDERAGAAIVLVPDAGSIGRQEHPVRPWVHWLLFGLTVLTTTWAGAAHQGIDLLREPSRFAVGLPYSLGLMAILGIHELGHFFTARRHGMRVTPPYFIPIPFSLGTFGAFIQMRSPAENRRALFDVAVALVTALNLLPIGQLDGGHIARAMFGARWGQTISSVSLWSLFLLAIFVWPSLLMWAIIIFFIAGRGASPLEDVSSLPPWRQWLGYATFAILIAILLPLPHALWQAAAIHCPYM